MPAGRRRWGAAPRCASAALGGASHEAGQGAPRGPRPGWGRRRGRSVWMRPGRGPRRLARVVGRTRSWPPPVPASTRSRARSPRHLPPDPGSARRSPERDATPAPRHEARCRRGDWHDQCVGPWSARREHDAGRSPPGYRAGVHVKSNRANGAMPDVVLARRASGFDRAGRFGVELVHRACGTNRFGAPDRPVVHEVSGAHAPGRWARM